MTTADAWAALLARRERNARIIRALGWLSLPLVYVAFWGAFAYSVTH